jgi:hypothetical protein
MSVHMFAHLSTAMGAREFCDRVVRREPYTIATVLFTDVGRLDDSLADLSEIGQTASPFSCFVSSLLNARIGNRK